jgi:acyl-CoA oxidase
MKYDLGASLGALLGGRMGIVSLCASNLGKAAVIATRYSAVRRQFGPTEAEVPVLEYQLQVFGVFIFKNLIT